MGRRIKTATVSDFVSCNKVSLD